MNTSFWILLALGLLLIAFAIVIKVSSIVFLKPEAADGPQVTVNYYTEYNKISKPNGFDPNDNADELYKKAGEVYVPPTELAAHAKNKEFVGLNENDKVLKEWLKNNHPSMEYSAINESEKAALREWIEKNAECMKYIEEGNKKRFFWAEEDENRNDDVIQPGNLGPKNINEIILVFEQRSKVAAMDGHFDDALTALIECWKIGQHYTNPNLFWTQQASGMFVKEHALDMSLKILDCFNLDINDLQLWQERWQKVFDEDKYRLGFKTHRLFWYDYVQRNFVYHPEGKGRLDRKKAENFYCLCGHGIDPRRSCEIGPTSKEVLEIVEYACKHYESYEDETPWFWYYPEQKFQREIEEWKAKHPIPDIFVPNIRPYWFYYHRLKAKSEALVTVIALQRYKIDHGHYPKNLGALMGYVTKTPKDPFSGEFLVYHWLVDDFELYSVGPDFNDDGGKRSQIGNPLTGIGKGDDVFWPPFRKNRENIKFYSQRERPGS
jgi:hypothetical protein